jgi:AraC-like DNA-binding protein
MSDEAVSITEICYSVGFNNLSNFNRHFLTQKGMPPSRFRTLLIENTRAAQAA